jgi:dTMP kinase
MIVFFEGLDFSGKSTVSKAVAEALQREGMTVCHSRAPGGTPAAERIRTLLMGDQELHADTILLLMSASANEQREWLRGQAKVCDVVVMDRWLFSTFAYQHAMGANPELIRKLIDNVMFIPYDPRVAFFLRVSPEVRAKRMAERGGAKDRFEAMAPVVSTQLKQNYTTMLEWHWLTPIDADRPLEIVVADAVSRIKAVEGRENRYTTLPYRTGR